MGAEAFSVSPFSRLARTHACSAAGDALFTIALADSLFFSIDPNDARWQIALYLLVTVAPFAVVAPWLGPAMDRLQGGHRYMMILSAAARAVIAVAVGKYIDSFALFPLAFSMLVMGKAHHVAKSALVPGFVHTDEGLVKANSRLSIISAVSAGVIGVPGVILLRLGGPPWVMGLAAMVFFAGAVLGLRIGSTKVAADAPDKAEKAELRGAGVILAASAMGYVRGVTGFLTMLLAFELRGGVDPGPIGVGVEVGHRIREALGSARLDLATGGAPKWHFGLVLAMLGVGGLAGAIASPRLRSHVREERILSGVLGAVGLFGLLGALSGGIVGAMLVSFMVAVAGQAGKQSFDAIVQRDAPKANLARSFSRFESRFQLVWVFGALLPVIVPLPARIGFLMVAVASAFASISYWLGRDPAPSTAKSKAGLASMVKSRKRQSGSDDPDSATDQGAGAGVGSMAGAASAAESSSGGNAPVDPAIASVLNLPADRTGSIFDAPDPEDEFSSNFDFGPSTSSGSVGLGALDQGHEATKRFDIPVGGLEPPVSPPVASPTDPTLDQGAGIKRPKSLPPQEPPA